MAESLPDKIAYTSLNEYEGIIKCEIPLCTYKTNKKWNMLSHYTNYHKMKKNQLPKSYYEFTESRRPRTPKAIPNINPNPSIQTAATRDERYKVRNSRADEEKKEKLQTILQSNHGDQFSQQFRDWMVKKGGKGRTTINLYVNCLHNIVKDKLPSEISFNMF